MSYFWHTHGIARVAALMVVTPWGDSDSLRQRQLRPGHGIPPPEVERSQRERLFAAVVATVARKGFAATTVADLAGLSGVSSRSFYDFFGDKATCLRATIEEILTGAGNLVKVEMGEDFEDGALRSYKALAEAIVAQPAAAKVCLVDSYAAGPAAVEPLTAAVADYEAELRRRLRLLPERAGMPAEMVAARVGGFLEIVRTRLRRGGEAELLRLGEDLVALILADRPPPVPLRLSVRPPKAEPESLAAPEHAERAIRA